MNRRRWWGVVAVMAATGPLAACGSSGTDVTVEMRGFDLSIDPPSTKADSMSMDLDNSGDISHRLVVVEARVGLDELPLTSDGAVDLDALAVVDELPEMRRGRYRSTVPVIRPGDYYLLCTLVADGESHYALGVRAAFRITPNDDLYNGGA